MSNCLILEVKETVLSNGNVSKSFTAYADFGLLGDDFISNTVKIDTGCGLSTFPYYRLTGDRKLCRKMKREDINQKIPYTFSYGVESGGKQHVVPTTVREKMKSEAIKFRHTMQRLVLAGYELGDNDIYINYDRSGNILIGMDILSKLDIFMGNSRVNGNYMLIGCLQKQDDKKDFYSAVKRHFAYT